MAESETKYQKLKAWIKENIDNGTFKPGDKLTSEPELVTMFGISRQTVRHATGDLVKQGLLIRKKGSGTYITETAFTPVVFREKTMNIAVISTFYESYIFPSILKGIEEVLSENGYTMQVSFTNNQIAREAQILKNLLEKDNIDAVIIEPAKSALPNPNLHYYEEIIRRGIQVICFNAEYPGLKVPCVRIDDQAIAKKATDLLISLGHKDIAGIFKSDDGQGKLRYAGYMEALLEHDCILNQNHILWLDTPMASDMSAYADYIFTRISDCQAVVCYNDQIAYQLIDLALKRGIKIPEELSVVGIDDAYLASISRVPITSFPHPKEELGKTVAANLIQLINDPSFDGNTLFDCDPIFRASTSAKNL